VFHGDYHSRDRRHAPSQQLHDERQPNSKYPGMHSKTASSNPSAPFAGLYEVNKEIAEIKCQNLARAVLYSCLAGIMPSLNISCSEQPYRRYKRPCKGTRDDLNPTVTTMYINLRSQNTPLPMDMSMTGRVLIRSIVSRLKFARRQRSAILPLPERAGRDKETDVGADRCQVAAWSSFRRVAERDHQHQG
jgi:hypothetical protein